MSTTTTDPRMSGARRAPPKGISLSWSDPRFRAIVWQVVIVGLLVGGVWYLASNTATNLEQRRIATGFDFLGRTAGIPIGEFLIPYDPSVHTYGRAVLVGILNTSMVTIVGVALITVLGTLVGIASLFDFIKVARLIGRIEDSLRGRLLVFFPGEYRQNVYRFMDARDGFNYMAVPITSSENFLLA